MEGLQHSYFLLIVLSLLCHLTASFQFDVAKSVVQSNRQWTRVKLGVAKTVSYPQLFYDEYPEGWSQVLSYVYIPANQRMINRKYPCRVRARDSSGLQLKSTVVFIVSDQKVYLTNLLLPYDQIFDNSFYNSGIFSGKPNMTIAKSTAQPSLDPSTNATDFTAQQDIVDKLALATELPGAGVQAILQGVTDSGNNSIPLTTAQSAVRMREEIRNNSTGSVSVNVQIPSTASTDKKVVTDISNPSLSSSTTSISNTNNVVSQNMAIINKTGQSLTQINLSPTTVMIQTNRNVLTPTISKNNNLVVTQTTATPSVAQTQTTTTATPVIPVTPASISTIQQAATLSTLPVPTVQQFLSSTSSQPMTLSLTRPTITIPSAPFTINGVLSSLSTISSVPSATGNPATVIAPLLPQSNSMSTSEKELAYVNAIKSTDIQELTQQKSIQSIFFKLPGPQELDSIILSADSYGMMKIIQKVISSQLSCEQKISYLSELLGRIQSAISMKSFAAAQLAVIVEGAQIQIDRLNASIAEDRAALDQLGLKDLRDKLSQALVDLEMAYSAFNTADLQIPPKQSLVAGYRQNIDIITMTANNNRQQIPMQKIQLNEINSQASQLESQLADVKAKRDVFQTNINKLNESVKSYDAKISSDKTQIRDLQTEINKRLDQASKLKNQYKDLQILIQIEKTNITTIQKRQKDIELLLPNLQEQANNQKAVITNTAELEKVRSQINNLQATLPIIKTKIDQNNFKCNQVTNVQPVKVPVEQVKQVVELPKVEVVNKTETPAPTPTPTPEIINQVIPVPAPIIILVSYEMNIKEYHNYINSCYRIRPDAPSLQISKTVVTPLSILDPLWIQKFGSPTIADLLPALPQGVSAAGGFVLPQGTTLPQGVILPQGALSLLQGSTLYPQGVSVLPGGVSFVQGGNIIPQAGSIVSQIGNISPQTGTVLTQGGILLPQSGGGVIQPGSSTSPTSQILSSISQIGQVLSPSTAVLQSQASAPLIIAQQSAVLSSTTVSTYYPQDFNCLNPEYLESGYGIIKNISRKFVEIQDQTGTRITLNLGTCSRIQATQQLPKIGQKMYYRGRRLGRGSFNMYRGSCM